MSSGNPSPCANRLRIPLTWGGQRNCADTDLERMSLAGPTIKDLRDLLVIETGAQDVQTNSLCVNSVASKESVLNTAENLVPGIRVLAGSRAYAGR